MMGVALLMLVALWLMLTRTRIGLVIQAALTHPDMVESLGHNVPRVFMLVFGSGCALAGAFVGSILIGLLQTLPLTVDKSLVHVAKHVGWNVVPGDLAYPLMKITLAQAAPILPYLLLVLILIFRPKGLLGTREG